jgi:hypothetical protein
MKVAEVMSPSVVTVGPGATWGQVTERMLDTGVSGLPVTDDDGYLLGVVTGADLVSKPAFGDRHHGSLLTSRPGTPSDTDRYTGSRSEKGPWPVTPGLPTLRRRRGRDGGLGWRWSTCPSAPLSSSWPPSG